MPDVALLAGPTGIGPGDDESPWMRPFARRAVALTRNVVGMEVNGGEDVEWFVMVLTTGSTPCDRSWAVANRRLVAVHAELAGGAPGTPPLARPIDFTADGGKHVLGSRVPIGKGKHSLAVAASGLPVGSRIALIGSSAGQAAPVQLGTVDADGTFAGTHAVPGANPHWWFAVVCSPATLATDAACGTDQDYAAITAPIWFE